MSLQEYDTSQAEGDVTSEDIEDEMFLRLTSSDQKDTSNSCSNDADNSSCTDVEKPDEIIDRRRREIEDRTVSSTERAMSQLEEAEDVGVESAEELIRQKEQLDRTERSLETINTSLRFSQKHIRGIKSIFGAVKNFFGSKHKDPPPQSESSDSSQSQLSQTLDDLKRSDRKSSKDNQIGLKSKKLLDEKNISSQRYQEKLNRNLDNIFESVHRLKGLAHGLGNEIESQNNLIENVISKADKVDETLTRQNKDVNKLLN